MTRRLARFLPVLLSVLALVVAPRLGAEGAPGGTLVAALETELARSVEKLRDAGAEPLYFLAYRATETSQVTIASSYGVVANESEGKNRTLDVEARVGSPLLDNTHELRESFEFGGGGVVSRNLPVEDDASAIRAAAWLATDQAWKAAQERLVKVKTNRGVKVEEEDASGDFAPAEPQRAADSASPPLEFDRAAWRERLKRLSAFFRAEPAILDSAVVLQASSARRTILTSEGTRIETGDVHVRLVIQASAKADDGMDLELSDIVDAETPDGLPDEKDLEARVRDLARRVLELRAAPIVEPYAGPAIVMNRAAAVFFHEIFGHRMEGHRQKSEEEGQTFTKKVNQPVMPDFLSVTDDPTLASFAGIPLNGHYRFDDEGVAAERVPLVEDGVLRSFLMSRSPIEGFPKSNGHGRCSPGRAPVARQGNLVVSSKKTVPFPRLREMLIERLKERGRPYGLVFHDISGGFTTTQRSGPQAFKVIPLYVQRVYVDGRPDEVVRGVDLVGTPLATLSRIEATADDPAVFNGVCGAESGWVPVSAISPSLLVAEIEIEKKEKGQERPPLLPPPAHDPEASETEKGGGK